MTSKYEKRAQAMRAVAPELYEALYELADLLDPTEWGAGSLLTKALAAADVVLAKVKAAS